MTNTKKTPSISWLMDKWQNETYRQNANYLYQNRHIRWGEKQLCNAVLARLGIMDKMMDGHSVQSLPVINEGNVPVVYSDVMHNMLNGYVNPMNYVLNLVLECSSYRVTNVEEAAGIVGRGLRALPSFLREVDLKDKLSVALPDAKVQCASASQDVADHTDVIVAYGGKSFHVWSYQCTPRGLENTSHRLLGKRGELVSGLHVLCPFDMQDKSQLVDVGGWYLHSDSYVKKVAAAITAGAVDSYADVCAMPLDSLKNTYMKDVHVVLKGECPSFATAIRNADFSSPCYVSAFCKKFNEVAEVFGADPIKNLDVTGRLVKEGYLEARDAADCGALGGRQNVFRLPTAKGIEAGISTQEAIDRNGKPYPIVIYGEKAQRMLVEKFAPLQ